MVNWELITPSLFSFVIVGVMSSIFIHILDRNTEPNYISKRKQRQMGLKK